MSEPKGPSTFVNEAYRVAGERELIDFYRKWAEEYDDQMLGLGYISPRETARLLAAHLPDPAAEILDLGCGTGLTAGGLAALGYTAVDGIDLSADMVRIAGPRGIYRNLFVADLNQPLPFADASYDGALSSGTFTHGHVGPEPLDEILRILRPGGVLACTVHCDLWESAGFAAKFAALADSGRAIRLEQRLGRYYENRPPEGWFCAYRKPA